VKREGEWYPDALRFTSLDEGESVIPGLTRNLVFLRWIPAFAGMTSLESITARVPAEAGK
ncbi:hypothetical protein, partial [Candidatus Methylomirabilis sp.]|uniref:hypothetical protein n=1 Tax=Candidatus Methylomirabilis sp. TaxID=2032687 RepID=UPI003C746786